MEVKKLLTMDRALHQEVQDWRFSNKIETATEAIRRLLKIALEIEAKRFRRGHNKPKSQEEAKANSHISLAS